MAENDSTPIERLKSSAQKYLGRELAASEIAILDSFDLGSIDNSPDQPPDPCPLPPEGVPKAIVGSDFLQWLVVNATAQDKDTVTSIALFNVSFEKLIDLSYAEIRAPVTFRFCEFKDKIVINDTTSRTLEFGSCNLHSIMGDRLNVKGRLSLVPDCPMHDVPRPPTVVKDRLRLCGAFVSGNFDLRRAKIGTVGGYGMPLFADGIEVRGNFLLINGCTINGLIKVNGIVVGRNLDFSGASIFSSDYTAIAAENAVVNGDVLLRKCPDNFMIYKNHVGVRFVSVGRISFENASIEGKLDCHGARFNHAGLAAIEEGADKCMTQKACFLNKPAQAFCGDRMSVKGSVEFAYEFEARGEVRLINAEVHGDLICRDGLFDHAGDLALIVDGIDVQGTTYMDEKFRTTGIVSLIHGTLKEGLYFQGSKFQSGGHKPTGFKRSLPASGPPGNVVGVRVRFEEGDRGIRGSYLDISGKLDLRDMQFGGDGSESEPFKVDLFHAQTTVLQDSKKSWPQSPNHLDLVGFTYEGIDSIANSLEWWPKLVHKHYARAPFNRQPYLQLGKILRASGYEKQARRLGIERETDATKFGDYSWASRQWRHILRAVIGYGYRTRRALGWLLGIWLASSLVFHYTYLDDQLIRAKRGVPQDDIQTTKLVYPDFNSLTFTLDLIVPIVNLRQSEYWIPTEQSYTKINVCTTVPAGGWFGWVRWFYCFLKVAIPGSIATALYLVVPFFGWFFTTIFIAGFTGIVKKD